jgi:hypothetical protein
MFSTLGTLAKIWGQRDGLANYRPSHLKREGPSRTSSFLLFHTLRYSLADPTRQLRLQIGEPYPRDTIKRFGL